MVDVAWGGVCHSQLNEVRGRKGPDRYLPHTLGHEGAGVVSAVGPDVAKVKLGDRVVMTWIKGKGAEVPSTRYEGPDGPVNSGAVSTFMRRAVVSENRLVAIPDAMPLCEAALLGCAVPTGAGIVFNVAQVTAGDSVAVFGAGGVGLSAVIAAKLREADPIIAVDVLPGKLEAARQAGASHLVDAGRDDPLQAIRDITEGRGVDVAIEAAGRRESMEAAFESVRGGGGVCVVAGNLADGERIAIDPFNLIRGKRLVGTWGGDTEPDRDIPRYADMFLKGHLDLSRLISGTYPLSAINQAFDDLEQGIVVRAMIDMAPPN